MAGLKGGWGENGVRSNQKFNTHTRTHTHTHTTTTTTNNNNNKKQTTIAMHRFYNKFSPYHYAQISSSLRTRKPSRHHLIDPQYLFRLQRNTAPHNAMMT
jgi:hypothetical protein